MKLKPMGTAVMLPVLLLLFISNVNVNAADRRELSLFMGTGFAASSLQGPFIEVGAEIPVKKFFYLQGVADYYFSPDGKGVKDDSAYGVSLYTVFKFELSNRWGIYIKAGPNYTIHNTREYAFGVDYPVKDANAGFGAGLGFHYILAHRLYLQFGATAKATMVDGKLDISDSYWFKFYCGFRYLVGVQKEN